jgi:hypothetical protein
MLNNVCVYIMKHTETVSYVTFRALVTVDQEILCSQADCYQKVGGTYCLHVEQHVPGSTSTTSNLPKQKNLSILAYTWTDASPGISTSLPHGNILALYSPKCI